MKERARIIQTMEDIHIHEVSKKGDPFHYYPSRHKEGDWSIPDTIEDHEVYANFWGTIVTMGPIDFDANGIYQLSRKEKQEIERSLSFRDAINAKMELTISSTITLPEVK